MYRYETFHDDICMELINNVHNGSNHQAYIFEGPQGINILESAKLFAAALVCNNAKSAPCGVCESCKLTYAENNPDIVFVNSGDKKSIGVDKIREISKDVYIKPFEAEKKVYIIENGEIITDEAQNAMLKILEEPPEYAVFIIITISASMLLSTVLSRCTRVRFTPLSERQMRKYLEEHYDNIEQNMDFLVKFSQGIPKAADDIIADEDFVPLREEAFNMLVPLLSKHKISAYTICEFLENNKEKAELIFDLWQSFLRDIMLIQNNSERLLVNLDLNDEITKLAGKLNDKCCIIALEQIIKAKYMLKRYVNLHILALKLSFSIKKAVYGN